MKQYTHSSEQAQFSQAYCETLPQQCPEAPKEAFKSVSEEAKDWVERITIRFHRSGEQPIDTLTIPVTWDYREQLSIDRAEGTLKQIQTFGEKCVVTHQYYVPEGIADFLDCLDIYHLLEPPSECPDDLIDNPEDRRFYEMEIIFRHHTPHRLFGYLDRYGAPSYWPSFMEDIRAFMDFYGNGEITSPFLYYMVRRRKSDYIFCSVEFNAYGNSYYYLTTDDTIEPGDLVLVPVGEANIEKTATVTKVAYFQAEQVPFPLEKTKSIVRKLEPGKKAGKCNGNQEEIFHQGMREL